MFGLFVTEFGVEFIFKLLIQTFEFRVDILLKGVFQFGLLTLVLRKRVVKVLLLVDSVVGEKTVNERYLLHWVPNSELLFLEFQYGRVTSLGIDHLWVILFIDLVLKKL